MLNWTLFVIFGIFVDCAVGQYPGARMILTSKALDYGNTAYVITLIHIRRCIQTLN